MAASDCVADFFCDHRALDIVSWNPATAEITFRCQGCGKQAVGIRAFTKKAYA